MTVKYLKLVWIQASPARLVQGVKYGRVPRGAIRGGNGSYLVIDNPAEIHIITEDENGNTYDSGNVIQEIRNIKCWSRITAGRVEQLRSELNFRGFEFEINESGKILNLAKLL
ncbi:MAG: hypothetical protein MJ246_08185 [Clostridia bacterium]|nr:hypothetical protein [Clostridia bacterium]